MASYYYLISSLPMLRAGDAPPLDYAAFLDQCRGAVSDRVYRSLEELTVRSEAGGFVRRWAARLEELVGLHSCDDCALYGYALKLQLLERQRVFRHDEGKAAFDTLLGQVRQQIFSL